MHKLWLTITNLLFREKVYCRCGHYTYRRDYCEKYGASEIIEVLETSPEFCHKCLSKGAVVCGMNKGHLIIHADSYYVMGEAVAGGKPHEHASTPPGYEYHMFYVCTRTGGHPKDYSRHGSAQVYRIR